MKLRILLVVLAILFVSIATSTLIYAKSNAASQIGIISLKHNALTVNHSIKVTVNVGQFDQKQPERTMKNMDQAVVMLNLTKDDKQKRVTLKSNGAGNYTGSITLDSTGTWDVSVIAFDKAQPVSENDMDTLETTWDVNRPKDHSSMGWLIGFIVLILVIIFYLLLRKGRKKKAALEGKLTTEE
ncbi:hypothetical protein GCM10011391_11170 [Pullulanibacillus camelliae]|uniref:YtkA-like domain-containing protein n=1 Tax=Pullulanibacillus camelliae TaxID=1707096 RepID=A0A8J2VN06_9BACL|nr:hypothetical protein [Pullulanibacillus camelliae]GGE34229.1 hypothetical protein GCM10011391_11170 [Pullulanibacillus camelliae]